MSNLHSPLGFPSECLKQTQPSFESYVLQASFPVSQMPSVIQSPLQNANAA